MDIKEAKADLVKRQQDLAKRLNGIIAQIEALMREKQQTIEEILRNNGEARMLDRLNGDKPTGKKKPD